VSLVRTALDIRPGFSGVDFGAAVAEGRSSDIGQHPETANFLRITQPVGGLFSCQTVTTMTSAKVTFFRLSLADGTAAGDYAGKRCYMKTELDTRT